VPGSELSVVLMFQPGGSAVFLGQTFSLMLLPITCTFMVYQASNEMENPETETHVSCCQVFATTLSKHIWFKSACILAKYMFWLSM
jgi:hypothetical protein